MSTSITLNPLNEEQRCKAILADICQLSNQSLVDLVLERCDTSELDSLIASAIVEMQDRTAVINGGITTTAETCGDVIEIARLRVAVMPESLKLNFLQKCSHEILMFIVLNTPEWQVA